MKRPTVIVTIGYCTILGLLACVQVGLSATFEESKIVNGAKASPAEFPYMVSIQENGKQKCGGSIVNENYVVTAAQCVSGVNTQNLLIIAGTTNLDDLTGASIHKVSGVKAHELYNASNSWINDIALVKVDPPFEFSLNVDVIDFPSPWEILELNATASIIGFGSTKKNGNTSKNLLKSIVFLISRKQCQLKYLDETIYRTQVCSLYVEQLTGFCNGDTGGPLIIEGKVEGIISFSNNGGCQSENSPQVYTRLSKYVDWIVTNSL